MELRRLIEKQPIEYVQHPCCKKMFEISDYRLHLAAKLQLNHNRTFKVGFEFSSVSLIHADLP